MINPEFDRLCRADNRTEVVRISVSDDNYRLFRNGFARSINSQIAVGVGSNLSRYTLVIGLLGDLI